jgi:hypothetical protein
MTQDDLTEQVDQLAHAVVSDPRWQDDTLGVAVLGMLLYGYAMAVGRMVMLLNVDDIDAAVVRSMTGAVGAAEKWSAGLVAEANASAFDKSHHPGNFDLIGVGHSYFGEDDQAVVVDNVFANIASARRRRGS